MLNKVRQSGIASEIYPESAKMKKQMDYANRKNIPWVVLIGKDEMQNGKLTLKDMETGEQQTINNEDLIRMLNSEVAK